jgi:hypothetical protein
VFVNPVFRIDSGEKKDFRRRESEAEGQKKKEAVRMKQKENDDVRGSR